jgi:formyltetrahydrofolate hydrolase
VAARRDHVQLASISLARCSLGRFNRPMVLARAVGWQAEDRVLVHANKTIVFAQSM